MAVRSGTVPAGQGVALRLAEGEAVVVTNTHGTQVVDAWAFAADDAAEHMSMEHSRVANYRMIPEVGGDFVTNRRRAILTLEADTSPGIHDTLLAACDPERYRLLGCPPGHRNCAENMVEALAAIGEPARPVPAPLNLFMNIPVLADRRLEAGLPAGRPGEAVTLRARIGCVVVLSACPMDVVPINGADRVVRDARWEILAAR